MKRFLVIAALATLTAVAHAQQPEGSNAPAAPASSSSALTSAPGAAGSTTATLEQQEAADAKKSKWSLSAVIQAGMNSSELNYSNRKEKSYSTDDLIGLGYKIDKTNSVGFKQYFSVNHDADKEKTTSDLSYPVLTYGHTFKGVAKSDDISALFWYYVPVTTNDYKYQNNGILRMDAEIAWTLTPKWTISYYLNPRQSLIPTQTTGLDAEGKAIPIFAKSTLIQYATLYYNISDSVSYYAQTGFRHDWNTRKEFALASEKFMFNLAGSYTMFKGKVNITPEVDYEVVLPRDSSNVKVASAYNEDNVSYVVTGSVTF